MGAILKGLGLDIWREVVEEFGRLRGRPARDLWLAGARPRAFLRGLFTLDVDDATTKAAIDGTYLADLEAIFHSITGSPVRLRVRVEGEAAPLDDEGGGAGSGTSNAASARRGASSERVTAAARKDGATMRLPAARALLPEGPEVYVPTVATRLAAGAIEQLVRGDVSLLFVHGPSGCGKTALAGWALQRLTEALPDSDPLVLSGESLALDVQRASRDRTFGALQRDWSGRDVVVLDEAHRLRGRDTAQQVAVSLVGPAVDRGGRVLVLSRHAPRQIQALGDRLLSHFLGGLVVAVDELDVADREAVLAAHARRLPIDVEEGVVQALAARAPGPLGEVVGLLGSAAGSAAREKRSLRLADVERWLRGPQQGELSLDALIAMVSAETGIEADRIRSSEKSRHVAHVRHLCVYLAARSLGLSARQICRSFRQRSPSIVAYARRAVERQRGIDPSYEQLIQTVQARLAGAQRDFAW